MSSHFPLSPYVPFVLPCGCPCSVVRMPVLLFKRAAERQSLLPRSGQQGHTRDWTDPSSHRKRISWSIRSSRSNTPLPCTGQVKNCGFEILHRDAGLCEGMERAEVVSILRLAKFFFPRTDAVPRTKWIVFRSVVGCGRPRVDHPSQYCICYWLNLHDKILL